MYGGEICTRRFIVFCRDLLYGMGKMAIKVVTNIVKMMCGMGGFADTVFLLS